MNKSRKKSIIFSLAVFAVVFSFSIGHCALADDEEDIKDEIKDISKDLKKEEANLNKQTSNLQVTQIQINTTASLLKKTETEISRKESEIKNLEERIALNKEIMVAYAQEMYFNEQEASWALNLSKSQFSDYFQNFDQMLNTKEKILFLVEEIKNDKKNIETAKIELAEKKEEHEDILADKYAEKKEIVSDINETKLTIAQLQAKINKLRSALSKFLGKSYSMDDVVDAVKFAEKKTGVRKQFLMAVLDKETDLGRYTGGCTYDKSKMGSTNLGYFKDICEDLGYNYKKMKVSCALSYGIGGAMGVAQFMPSTWMGYKDSISSKTGNKPADPWNLEDGVMGMALYLKNKGGDKKSGEYQAAAMYYCGGNWKRTVCKNYANTVISWSKGYEDYF